MSQESASRITGAVIQTFIVLTILSGVFSESELKKCIRYIKQLYIVTDPLEMYRKGFLSFSIEEIKKINANLAPKTDPTTNPEELQMIVEKMNRYTIKYFKRVQKKVKIRSKHLLPGPDDFCEGKFLQLPIVDSKVDLCAIILKKKFDIHDITNGSEVFDLLYAQFTKNDVQKMLLFIEELGTISWTFESGLNDPCFENPEQLLDHYSDSTSSYYRIFVNKLNGANVSKIPTPEQYCIDEICESEDEFIDCLEEFDASTSSSEYND